MTDGGKAEILQMLAEGEDVLRAALAGMSEQEATRRPAEGRWSVIECVAHVAAAEAALLERLGAATPVAESHEDRAREAKFSGLALDRQRRIEAPPQVQPACECGTLAEALERFRTVRAKTVRFVDRFEGDLRCSLAQHPLITRPVNCYEMLLLMALHPRRHAEQIAEIRAGMPH